MVELGRWHAMHRGGVERSGREALDGIVAGGVRNGLVDAVESGGLAVNRVDATAGEV